PAFLSARGDRAGETGLRDDIEASERSGRPMTVRLERHVVSNRRVFAASPFPMRSKQVVPVRTSGNADTRTAVLRRSRSARQHDRTLGIASLLGKPRLPAGTKRD